MVHHQVGDPEYAGVEAVDHQHGRASVRVGAVDVGRAGNAVGRQHHDERHPRRKKDQPDHRDL